ncbi:28405_t:CDS:1, partial [Dentiscutata erythropus]
YMNLEDIELDNSLNNTKKIASDMDIIENNVVIPELLDTNSK